MTPLQRIIFVSSAFALGVFATSLRAQTCSAAPLFDMTGPNCSTSRQGNECLCSECLAWDPAPGATWYEIQRCDGSGAQCTIVGDTRFRNHAAYTSRGGVSYAAIRPTVWCAPWDNPFPVIGAPYEYKVRSCTDGASGPICATTLSNPVGYVAAPYMCIDNGLEISCRKSASPRQGFATDFDNDGITDAMDLDDDGDRIPDTLDNCPLATNIGQRDADGDGAGDACDLQPLAASGAADADRDGVGDLTDDCPSVYDPLQADSDHDRTGNACDNCPSAFNEMQTDVDEDGEGDRCDLDDGTIYGAWNSRTELTWAQEVGFTTWCVYRGDLAELRLTGTYTQSPGVNPRAARFCGLTAATINDAVKPAPGATAFYLVGGRPGPSSSELGTDSAGVMRPNDNPCP